jgi:hypothetical protein
MASNKGAYMLYELTVPQFTKMLRNLDAILLKGLAQSEAKKFDVGVLLQARLAPDQFNLIKQVQIACDTIKLGTSRLAGKDAPKHEDNETTLDELRKRIQDVIAYLAKFTAKDFDGADEKRITTPRWEGKTLSGYEFAVQHMIPNAYFHVTTAYSILRHNGVDVGKKDYLGELPFKKLS